MPGPPASRLKIKTAESVQATPVVKGVAGALRLPSAREAVSQGCALPLSSILPTVLRAVPGQVPEMDLFQSQSGEWQYEFLVLTKDRRYRQFLVDARRNQIVAISPR